MIDHIMEHYELYINNISNKILLNGLHTFFKLNRLIVYIKKIILYQFFNFFFIVKKYLALNLVL